MAFDPHATAFSLPNAQLLGQAAAVAYRDRSACAAWAGANGFPAGTFDFFDHNDTQGFVAQNDEVILVSFRGTQPRQPMDWFADFDALPAKWGHAAGVVHKGFLNALHAVWGRALAGGREILPKRLLDRGNRKVWLTGHSLGGALAELCAAQAFFISQVPIQGVYTFGQPRVGNEAFAGAVHAAFGPRIFRFINDRDIVPRVPLFGMGFRHYGNETFFNHNGERSDQPSSIENMKAALRFAANALNFEPIAQAGELLAKKIASGVHLGAHGSTPGLAKDPEMAALGDLRAILQSGRENITDHDMNVCYLARLGTKL
jgi:triacylglycerol lipase